jgi:hypothetical protein
MLARSLTIGLTAFAFAGAAAGDAQLAETAGAPAAERPKSAANEPRVARAVITNAHRWELDGKPMADIPFQVGSPRWRVWSSKNLEPEWTGEWKVTVVGSGGEVLEEARFQYLPVAGERAPAAPAPSAN